jgi:hypothetical protein
LASANTFVLRSVVSSAQRCARLVQRLLSADVAHDDQEDTMIRNAQRMHLMLLAVSLSLFTPLPAHADTRAGARITVHDFYGPNAERLREQVVAVLEDKGLTIVKAAEVESAANKLGVDRFSPDGRKALSKELQLSAWLTGMSQRRKGKLSLTLVVYDGGPRGRLARTRFVASNSRALTEAVRGRLWDKAGRALLELEAPAGAEPIQVADATSSKKSTTRDEATPSAAEAERDRVAARGESLRAYLGVGSPYRSLSYQDPITSTLGDYRLNGAPVADLYFELHPARFVSDSWPSWLGVEARAQVALASPTLTQSGNQFKSRYDAVQVGMRARIPLGEHHLSVFSGYGLSRFAISASEPGITSPTPSVDYRSIRSGLGAELALSQALRVGLDAAWLNFLSVGEISRWFPRATAAGLELALSGTYHMTSDVYTRLAAVYSRAFFDFHAQPGDKYIAGGALDQSIALALGVGVQL